MQSSKSIPTIFQHLTYSAYTKHAITEMTSEMKGNGLPFLFCYLFYFQCQSFEKNMSFLHRRKSYNSKSPFSSPD